jgi:membrane-bound serine protease (ClpP class)
MVARASPSRHVWFVPIPSPTAREIGSSRKHNTPRTGLTRSANRLRRETAMQVRTRRIVAAATLMVAGLAMAGSGAAAAQERSPVIVDLSIDGAVDPWMDDYIVRNVERAAEESAEAVLIRIDTPGGLLSSTRRITQSILGSTVPVICYVEPQGARAASAGAFILMSCPVAVMAPATHVGASTPIGLSGGDLAEKITEDAAAEIRALAETYGRDVETAERFVTEAESITAEEALDAGVIDLISPSVDALLADLDGMSVQLGNGDAVTLRTAGATLQAEDIGGVTGFVHQLIDPSIAFLFFWLGLALIVLELLIPGHVFSGTVGTIILLLSLFSFGLLPVRLIGLLFLIASVVAFIIEIKAPGLGIWGAVGLICLLLGGWFLYDRSTGVEVSPWVLTATAGFVAFFFGFVVVKALSIGRLPPAQGAEAVVGKEGMAIAAGVGPKGGLVRVAAEEWQAISESGDIPAGATVKVTKLDGLVLTVERNDPEHEPAGEAGPATEGGN